MKRGLLPLLILLCSLILTLSIAHVTLAQADKPAATITLPATGSTSSNGDAFSITNSGLGRAGYFQVTNTKNVTSALEARTYSTSSNAIAISAGVMNSRPGSNSAAIVATNFGSGNAGFGVKATHRGSGIAIYGESIGAGGRAIYGSSRSSSGTGSGVYGEIFSSNGNGVYGVNRASGGGYGVYGEGYTGVYGAGASYGVRGTATGYGVFGSGATGVFGGGTTGVEGRGTVVGVNGFGDEKGVYGKSTGYGVYGEGASGLYGVGTTYGAFGKGYYGLYGQGSSYGVYGAGGSGYGVYGQGNTGVRGKGSGHGVYGESTASTESFYGGLFKHNVYVYGEYRSSLGLSVGIADPRDATKLIQQAGVISPEQLGMTNGNVTLDNTGRATVTLPAWFGSVYGDYRYMLTPVGDSANLFVAGEGKDSFTIAGGKAGLKVSWQVSGTRQDAAAKANPLKVEVDRASVEPRIPSLPITPDGK